MMQRTLYRFPRGFDLFEALLLSMADCVPHLFASQEKPASVCLISLTRQLYGNYCIVAIFGSLIISCNYVILLYINIKILPWKRLFTRKKSIQISRIFFVNKVFLHYNVSSIFYKILCNIEVQLTELILFIYLQSKHISTK